MSRADRFAVNDALTNLSYDFGVELDDDTLNELTHHVADVLDAARAKKETDDAARS